MASLDMVYEVVISNPERIWTPRDVAELVWPDLPQTARYKARQIAYTRLRVLERRGILKKVSGFNEPSKWVYIGKYGVVS